MPDPDTPPSRRAGRPRGPRRSADAARRLETARRRNLDQLAEQRRREHTIDTALTAYITAEDTIRATEADRDTRIAPLQDRINRITTDTEHRIRDLRHQQAQAAQAIHDAGRTVQQLADLLDLPRPTARHLLAEKASSPTTHPQQPNVTAPADRDDATSASLRSDH